MLREAQATDKMQEARKHMLAATHHDTSLSMDSLLAMGSAAAATQDGSDSDDGVGQRGNDESSGADSDDGLGGGCNSLLAAMGVGLKKIKAAPKPKAKVPAKSRSSGGAVGGTVIQKAHSVANLRPPQTHAQQAVKSDDEPTKGDAERRRGRPAKIRSTEEISETLVANDAALLRDLSDIIKDRWADEQCSNTISFDSDLFAGLAVANPPSIGVDLTCRLTRYQWPGKDLITVEHCSGNGHGTRPTHDFVNEAGLFGCLC